ncbi:uncharacterized protein LOC123298553 [Chrysoperla carnea]|uniref:uncharacterized protein LOC123298553 n=1 Tax=Chrysoperla carnea TaxID=189513 RepID=UPI001D07A7E5|nr:uncharacterized protein LOC123298553 [Chrysoperla carnea]XP_044736519.1 uncharacterized protein LOC123298553 [Chrysoperla carnea]
MIILKGQSILRIIWNNFLLFQILIILSIFTSTSNQAPLENSNDIPIVKTIRPMQNVIVRRINTFPNTYEVVPNADTSNIISKPLSDDNVQTFFYTRDNNFGILKGLDDVGPVTFPPYTGD